MTVELARPHQVTVYLDTDGNQHRTEHDAIRSTIKIIRSKLTLIEALINSEVMADDTPTARAAAVDYLALAPDVVAGVARIGMYYKEKFKL